MNRSQKIAVAVSGAVVIGLVALAAPAIAGAVSAAASWQSPVPAAAAAAEAEPVENVDVPDDVMAEAEKSGLIYAGNGTWFSSEGPGDCESNAAIHPYGAYDPAAKLTGDLVDMGASPYAQGEVGYNADGLIETYTVVAGDAPAAIGERFCVDYVTVVSYNGAWPPAQTIQPGDVLVLRP